MKKFEDLKHNDRFYYITDEFEKISFIGYGHFRAIFENQYGEMISLSKENFESKCFEDFESANKALFVGLFSLMETSANIFEDEELDKIMEILGDYIGRKLK